MNANRHKLIARAAWEAAQTVNHCRSVYDKGNRATYVFEPQENDLKGQFRWYYGQLRAAVNGSYRTGNEPNPGFAQFVYKRQVEVIE